MQRSWPAWAGAWAILLAAVACMLLPADATHAAAASTNVTLSVTSATSLDPSGCATGSAGTTFGIVQVGTPYVTTADCLLTWGSTNDSSMLRVFQQDGGGWAMSSAHPTTGIAAYWPLNDTTTDLSSTSNPVALGVAPADPAWVAGPAGYGSGLDFDGNDYVTAPANPAYDLSTFTVELWLNTTFGGIQVLVDKTTGTSCGNDCNFELYMNTGNVKGSLSAGGVNYVVSSAPALVNDGSWHHVGLVYDGATRRMSITVDGVERGNLVTPVGVDRPAAPVVIGTAQNFASGFTGQLDDVRIHNVARTPAELGGYAAGAIRDYAPGSADWGTATGMFGACLRAVTGSGVVGTWVTNATCPASDVAAPNNYWNAIPATSAAAGSKIAASPTAGVNDATAALRFGVRTGVGQRPAAYAAPISFVVIAPAA
jgi:hypothetical protein